MSLLPIIALGAFLRFYHIGCEGLWIDEAFSIWMGRQPAGQMLDWLVRIDQHPPLYYLLLHVWMRLGDGEAVVRAFSALCSTLTVPAIYLLGRRLAGHKLGLLAALILAVSPFHIRFAQEARMYALLALNGTLAMIALACLLTDPRAATVALGRQLVGFVRAWRATGCRPPLRAIETDLAWLAYALFAALTLLTHNTAVFFPLAANLAVAALLLTQRLQVFPSPRLFLRNWLLAQAMTLLLWLPWLPAFVSQSVSVYHEFWLPAPTLEKIVGAMSAFASDFLPVPFWVKCVLGLLCAALVVLGAVYFRRRSAHVVFLLALFLTPFLGEWLVSLRRPIFYDRTLIWASIPFYVLLAAGIAKLRWRALVIGGLALLLAVNGLSLRAYYADFEKEGWDEAAALVAEHVEPGDLILFNATWMQIPFDYYFHQMSEIPVTEHGAPVDLFDRGILEPKMAEGDLLRLRGLVADHRRVWLVYSHYWYTDPQGLIPAALEQELAPRGQWAFYGVQVRLYDR